MVAFGADFVILVISPRRLPSACWLRYLRFMCVDFGFRVRNGSGVSYRGIPFPVWELRVGMHWKWAKGRPLAPYRRGFRGPPGFVCFEKLRLFP